jgi:hypothetical protein
LSLQLGCLRLQIAGTGLQLRGLALQGTCLLLQLRSLLLQIIDLTPRLLLRGLKVLVGDHRLLPGRFVGLAGSVIYRTYFCSILVSYRRIIQSISGAAVPVSIGGKNHKILLTGILHRIDGGDAIQAGCRGVRGKC